LPKLPYGYKDLEPYISEEQLKIHHEKHHQGYVNGANAIFEQLEKARKENIDLDIKSTLKTLSFNIGGHRLHSFVLAFLSAEWRWWWRAKRSLRQCLKERVWEFRKIQKGILSGCC